MSSLLCQKNIKADVNLFVTIHSLYFQALSKPKEQLVLPSTPP